MDQTAVAQAKSAKPLDWVNIAFLTVTPLAAAALTAWYVWHHGFTKADFAIFLFMYLATGLGVTGGYHRYYAHRTYECSKLLQLFYLVFGGAAVENSVLNWASDHRDHHRYVDTEKDPYNILKGFFYAHMGWIFFKNARLPDDRFKNCPDLVKDPLVRWQDKYYLAIVGLAGFGLPTLLGALVGRPLAGFLWGGLVRTVFVQHMTFLINSAAHYWGERPYSDVDTARDSWWLGIFTFGEGYHNFHHKFQADYRNGIRWYQFDLAKWWLWGMNLLGQAGRFKKVPDSLILKAKLEVQARAIRQRLVAAQKPERMWELVHARVEAGRKRVEEAYAQYQHAKLDYQRRGAEWSADMRRQWHETLVHYERQLEDAHERWNGLCRAMYRIPVPRAHSIMSAAFVLDILKYKLW